MGRPDVAVFREQDRRREQLPVQVARHTERAVVQFLRPVRKLDPKLNRAFVDRLKLGSV
jgi:hypothetical protein